MSHTYQPHRSSQRDAGLRRLRQINRTLAAATVALTLLFVNAAARAFPGHVRAAKVTSPVSITFGGVTLDPADILYVGLSQFAGLYQVNIKVPAGVADGDQPLVITVGGVGSPANAFITVQSQ